MDDTTHITATEFARRAGVNRETVRRHILAGRLTVVRPGREYLLAAEQVSRFEKGKPGRPAGSKSSQRFSRAKRT